MQNKIAIANQKPRNSYSRIYWSHMRTCVQCRTKLYQIANRKPRNPSCHIYWSHMRACVQNKIAHASDLETLRAIFTGLPCVNAGMRAMQNKIAPDPELTTSKLFLPILIGHTCVQCRTKLHQIANPKPRNVESFSQQIPAMNATLPSADWPTLCFFAYHLLLAFSVCSGLLAGFLQPPLWNLKESASVVQDTTTKGEGGAVGIDPTKKELPVASKEDLKRPAVAYPTLLLLIGALGLYGTSAWLCWKGVVNGPTAMAMSTYAAYLSFAVLHDAVHFAVAPKHRFLNELAGHLAGIPLLAPFPMFRFIHLSHHRYSGDHQLDPDEWAGRGPWILLPLRWATVFNYYIYTFVRTMVWRFRCKETISALVRKSDRALLLFGVGFGFAFSNFIAFAFRSIPEESHAILCWCVLFPQMIAATILIYFFDYVPHRPHVIPYREDPFKSTNATSFMGSVDGFLWTSACLSQNMHIVHHLWPFMPWYTYSRLWKAYGPEILEKGTRIVPLFITRPTREIFEELQPPTDFTIKKSN